MGSYCANYYADPRCYSKVLEFGDFCTSCIDTKRGWSTEAINGRIPNITKTTCANSSADSSTTTSPTASSTTTTITASSTISASGSAGSNRSSQHSSPRVQALDLQHDHAQPQFRATATT